MDAKEYLCSDANIFHAIYSIKESIQEKNLLSAKEKDELLGLYDIFNEKQIKGKIKDIRKMLESYLEDDEKLFKAKVYFVPKSWDASKNKAKYRPLHTSSLNEQICMLAMLNCLVRDTNEKEDQWKIGGIAKMIPADFYGNILSEMPERAYKKWQMQYAEYTQRANDLQREYQNTAQYRYEISLDIEDFFPSIDPYYILCYYMRHLSVDIKEKDKIYILKILRKLLYIELDVSNLNQYFLKIYYNTEQEIDKNSKHYVRGVAQGLIQGYFFANLFMIEVSNVYRKVFCGRQLFYVDDSVIFSNKNVAENDGKKFIELIDEAEAQISEFVRQEIKEEYKNNFILNISKDNDYKIKIHNPKNEGDECKSTYIDLHNISIGEIFLGNIGRIASGVAIDLNNDFSAEELDMLESRLDILQREIEKEITMISEEIERETNKELLKRYTNYRKNLIRYRKYFYYRYWMINFRKKFSLDAIQKFIDEQITDMQKNYNERQKMFEIYTDNILGAMLSFFIRNLANEDCYDKEDLWKREKEICKTVDHLNDYLYEESAGAYKKQLSYVYKSVEDYICDNLNKCSSKRLAKVRSRRNANIINYKYKSLLQIISFRFPNMMKIAENKKIDYVKDYLKTVLEDENKIYNIFDDRNWKLTYAIVESNSNEIKRMILNASVSYLYNISISEDYAFAKQNNKVMTYSEIRLLAILRNKEFSIEILKEKLFEIFDTEDKIDYNILEVLQYFKRFVKRYDYIDQLICVHKYTCDLWKNGSKYLYFYTMHNQEHAIDLIKSAIEMVRAINYFKLKTVDYYILFIACYLHDISMVNIPDLGLFQKRMKKSNLIATHFQNEVDKDKIYDQQYIKGMLLNVYKSMDEFFENIIRSNHAKQSAWEIRNSRDLGFLDVCMKEVIAEVSEAHGYKTSDVYRKKSVAREMTYSLKYMQIILRLADLLDMKKYRISKILLSKNLENMSRTSAFHWISHSVTNDLKVTVLYSTRGDDKDVKDRINGYYSFLQPGRIEEKIELEIHYSAMLKSADNRKEKCKGVDMKLENGDIVIGVREHQNQMLNCDGSKCNMACKWFSIKNEYLLEELVELQRYLQDIADNFFYNTFAIRLVDDGDNKLIQKEFDIVKEYIDAY